jgi:hypothetical protein
MATATPQTGRFDPWRPVSPFFSFAERVRGGHCDPISVQEQEIVGHHALHPVAIPELEADPKALHFWTGLEDLAFRFGRLEFAHKCDAFHVRIGHHKEVSLGGNEFHALRLKVGTRIDMTGQSFAVVPVNQHFLVGRSGQEPSKNDNYVSNI